MVFFTQEDYDSLAEIIFRGDPRFDKNHPDFNKHNPLYVYSSKQKDKEIDYRDIVSTKSNFSVNRKGDKEWNTYHKQNKDANEDESYKIKYPDEDSLFGKQVTPDSKFMEYLKKAVPPDQWHFFEDIKIDYFKKHVDDDKFQFNIRRRFIRRVPVFSRSKGIFSRRNIVFWSDSEKAVKKEINFIGLDKFSIKGNSLIKRQKKKKELREYIRFMRLKSRSRSRCIFWQRLPEKKIEKNFKYQHNRFMQSRYVQGFTFKNSFDYSKSKGKEKNFRFKDFGNSQQRKFSTTIDEYVGHMALDMSKINFFELAKQQEGFLKKLKNRNINFDNEHNQYNDNNKSNQNNLEINDNSINYQGMNPNKYFKFNDKFYNKRHIYNNYDFYSKKFNISGNKNKYNNRYNNNEQEVSYSNSNINNSNQKTNHNKTFYDNRYKEHNSVSGNRNNNDNDNNLRRIVNDNSRRIVNANYHNKTSYYNNENKNNNNKRQYYNKQYYNRQHNYKALYNKKWSGINYRNAMPSKKGYIRYKKKKFLNTFLLQDSEEIQLLKFVSLYRILYKILKRYSNWGALEI